jgi:hypothetical protein
MSESKPDSKKITLPNPFFAVPEFLTISPNIKTFQEKNLLKAIHPYEEEEDESTPTAREDLKLG